MPGQTIALRVLHPDEWPLFRSLRLEALREAPDAFCSTLAEWQGEADTEARWRSRLTEVPFNAVAYVDGAPAGMVSSTAPNGTDETTLISMWVAPFARGEHVGEALIDGVLSWARAHGIKRVALDVRENNVYARRLYARCAFVDRGPIEGAAGSPPERRMVCAIAFPPPSHA